MSRSPGLCLSRELRPDHPALGRGPRLEKAPHADLGALSDWAVPSCRSQGSGYLGLFGIKEEKLFYAPKF